MNNRVMVICASGAEWSEVYPQLEALRERLPGCREYVVCCDRNDPIDWEIEAWALRRGHQTTVSFADEREAVEYVKGGTLVAFTGDRRVSECVRFARSKRVWYSRRLKREMQHKINVITVQL